MADDLDLQQLAEYLHLELSRVTKMAERGQLPGRKVAGQWRFHRAEVNQWLEQRIGGLEDDELERLETGLHRVGGGRSPHEFTLAELLVIEAIAVPLAARTRSSVIRAMVDLAAQTGWLWDPQSFAEAVRQREELYPTAMEGGYALLHPRRPLASILAQPFLALGRTETGIPFGTTASGLTDLFFLICSTDDAEHLQTLARLGRVLSQPGIGDRLREAVDAVAVREVLVETEQELLS